MKAREIISPRKSLTGLREEMRAVARGDDTPSPLSAPLLEAFGRPAAISWNKDELGWNGEFQTPSGRWFSIRISRLTREVGWAFEFSEVPQHVLWLTGRAEKPDPATFVVSTNPVGGLAPTGRGEQFSVYSTVLAAMREFLEAERPERVRFKGSIGRQTKLYQAMMKHHAADLATLGYKPKGAALVRRP